MIFKTSQPDAAAGNPSPAPSKIYRVGSLSYTMRGLAALFAWLLWGDFCFVIMEAVVPSIIPLKFKSLGASNTIIVLFMSTLPYILNATVCPWVSFKSDRYRSRWGRRLPFIIRTAPFLALSLILIGYSTEIGGWMHHFFFSRSGTISVAAVTIGLVGLFVVSFQFFNMFVNSVFWYLFNDVVPQALMGRFLGLFRVVGGLAGMFFNFFIFRYAESHMKEIFLGAALLYFFGFGLMCLKIREGEYPPPPENIGGRKSLWSDVRTFMTECYGLKHYRVLFLAQIMLNLGIFACGSFNIFYLRDIGLDLAQIGKISGCGMALATVLTYPAGMLVDRFKPIRVMIAAVAGMTLIVTPLNFVFLFHNFSLAEAFYVYGAIWLLWQTCSAINGAAGLPMLMQFYPKERFGQFCSASSLVVSVSLTLGGLAAGGLFDFLKRLYHGSNFYYRFIPVWSFTFMFIALCVLLIVYRNWRRHGGPDHYVPPQI
jgi:maltose/moltooligosaccharide transporter